MTTLNEIADALLSVTGFGEDTTKEYVLRQVNPTLNISATHVVSAVEPVDLILPMNVIWLCMNLNSTKYRKFLTRTSKQPSEEFEHTWVEVTNYHALWAPQFYDPSDIGEDSDIPNANSTDLGIARLTTDPSSVGRPTFVTTSDPRNTDKRDPLPHSSMHEEKAMVSVKTKTGQVSLDATQGTDGTTLVADSGVNASYEHLTKSNVLGE